jgi:hypothetical protein
MEAARSQDPGDKKSAQAASVYLTHLMRGARNIGTNSGAARIFPRKSPLHAIGATVAAIGNW